MYPLNRTILIALGVSLFAAPYATAQCSANLLNDSFNDQTVPGDLDDWTDSAPSPAAQNTADPDIVARTPPGFLHFQDTTTRSVEQSLTIPTGDTVEFTFYAKSIGGGTGTIRIVVDGVTQGTFTIADLIDQTGANGYTANVLPPVDVTTFADGAAHTIRIEGETSDAATSILVDDACLLVTQAPPPATGGCPSGASSLIIEGDFDPDDCADPTSVARVTNAWTTAAGATLVTCEDPPVNGNGPSGGYVQFETGTAGGTVSQDAITLTGGASTFLTFSLNMTANVINGQTFKVFITNAAGEDTQLWPLASLTADELTAFYNDNFGGASAGAYVQVVTTVQGLTAEPEDYELRFERTGAAEFFLDDVCVFGGGGFCLQSSVSGVSVTSSNPNAEPQFVGRGATALIEIEFGGNGFTACAAGDPALATFDIRTEAGGTISIDQYLVFANPAAGIIQFLVPIDSLNQTPPVDGITAVLIGGDPAPDTFVIDTVPPIVGPSFALPARQTFPQLIQDTTLPGFFADDFVAFSNDGITGQQSQTSNGAPALTNPLQPGNFVYTPYNEAYSPDNRVLTYATRSGRNAKVFFNDVGTDPLVVRLEAPFYDPPLDDGTGVLLTASGFINDPAKFVTVDSAQATVAAATVPVYDSTGGTYEDFAVAQWADLSFSTTGLSFLQLGYRFRAQDRAGNVRDASEEVLDNIELWWMAEARSRLSPNWGAVQPTPDQIYFDFAMDRGYEPNPLGAPLPIFNVEVFVGGSDPNDPFTDPYGSLGWIGWTPARRLTSAYFQDLLLDPTLENRWFAVRLVGADEAGNFEPPPDITAAFSGPNWQYFFLQAGEQAIDTTLTARFWWDSPDQPGVFNPTNTNLEQDLGSTNIVPMPPVGVPLEVAVQFDITAIVPPDVALSDMNVRWEIEDEQTGQVLPVGGGFMPFLTGRTTRVILPLHAAGLVLGDPARVQVKSYTFRAAARYDLAGAVTQDPTPAVYRFRVVPGSVQDYLESMTDPQDQPVRETQRLE